MKKKTFIQTIAIAAMISTGAMWNNAAVAANFTNGDFSSGFDGWQGQDDSNDYDPIPTSNPNFNAFSSAAILTTDFDANGSFAASIFQVFTVQNLTATGNTLTLDFDFTWDADDENGGGDIICTAFRIRRYR